MFYDRFLMICKENNLTPSQVAKDLGINRSTLSMWKTKGVLPNAITIMNISNYLNISPAYLMGNDLAKPNEKEMPDVQMNAEQRKQYEELMELIEKIPEEKMDAVMAMLKALASE